MTEKVVSPAALEQLEWQGDEMLALAEQRMQAVERRVSAYEMPLLDALEHEYADKIARPGWSAGRQVPYLPIF
jgi:hypothetical protein